MTKFVAVSALVLLLSSCGDSKESTTQKEVPFAKPGVNNPLANQQQLIKDAQGIQSLFDQNADEKNRPSIPQISTI